MRQWEIHTWRSWSRGVVSRRTMIEEEVRMKKRWVVIWTGSKRPLYSIQFFMPTYSYVVAKQCLLSITHIILWVPVGITLSSHTPNTLSPFSFTSQQISVKQRLAHPLTIPISTSVSPFNSVLSRDPRRRKSRMYACTGTIRIDCKEAVVKLRTLLDGLCGTRRKTKRMKNKLRGSAENHGNYGRLTIPQN